jgi:peptidoglycan hydrolase-like protein with peptidoglycan-binding domain
MKGTMALILAGMLVAGSSTALFAQQQQQQKPPPPKPAQAQSAPKPAAVPVQQAQAPKPMETPKPRVHPVHPWTIEQIKEAQTGLTAAKLYTGKVNGEYNSATRMAVREFQRAHSRPGPGNLRDSVLVLLRAQKPKP